MVKILFNKPVIQQLTTLHVAGSSVHDEGLKLIEPFEFKSLVSLSLAGRLSNI